MEAYYSNQASQSMPHFSGHYRQRGSGFGALARGIGRVALPLARKIIWPAAKRIGRELLVQGALESVEVAMKRKSAKKALKSTVAKTDRKQIDGSFHSRLTRAGKRLNVEDNNMLNLEPTKIFPLKKSFLENYNQEGVDWIFSRE